MSSPALCTHQILYNDEWVAEHDQLREHSCAGSKFHCKPLFVWPLAPRNLGIFARLVGFCRSLLQLPLLPIGSFRTLSDTTVEVVHFARVVLFPFFHYVHTFRSLGCNALALAALSIPSRTFDRLSVDICQHQHQI